MQKQLGLYDKNFISRTKLETLGKRLEVLIGAVMKNKNAFNAFGNFKSENKVFHFIDTY